MRRRRERCKAKAKSRVRTLDEPPLHRPLQTSCVSPSGGTSTEPSATTSRIPEGFSPIGGARIPCQEMRPAGAQAQPSRECSGAGKKNGFLTTAELLTGPGGSGEGVLSNLGGG